MESVKMMMCSCKHVSSSRSSISPQLATSKGKTRARAPLLLPGTRLPAFRIETTPALFSSSFLPDFSTNAGLPTLKLSAMKIKAGAGHAGALTSMGSVSVSAETLRWVFTAASALLMLTKNTVIRKPFLAPLLALQAPGDLLAWMRGEYGLWAAFLALLVRLFYHIPGELELPLMFLLLVITAPYQAMDLRGTIGAMVACACVAAFLAYQHFSGAGGLRGSFKEGTFLASIAVICLVGVPLLFLFGKF